MWGALKRNQQSPVLIILLLPLHKKYRSLNLNLPCQDEASRVVDRHVTGISPLFLRADATRRFQRTIMAQMQTVLFQAQIHMPPHKAMLNLAPFARVELT